MSIGHSASALAIITHPSCKENSISAAEIKRIYKGKIQEWAGRTVTPLDLDPVHSVKNTFLKHYLNMDVMKYRQFWMTQAIKGTGTAPTEMKTQQDVVKYVSSHPGAIAYVEAVVSDSTVKVLKIKE